MARSACEHHEALALAKLLDTANTQLRSQEILLVKNEARLEELNEVLSVEREQLRAKVDELSAVQRAEEEKSALLVEKQRELEALQQEFHKVRSLLNSQQIDFVTAEQGKAKLAVENGKLTEMLSAAQLEEKKSKEALVQLQSVARKFLSKMNREKQELQYLVFECCKVCGRSDGAGDMLLCDGCDTGYHTFCLTPPLREIPEGQWFCSECDADADSREDSSYENLPDGSFESLDPLNDRMTDCDHRQLTAVNCCQTKSFGQEGIQCVMAHFGDHRRWIELSFAQSDRAEERWPGIHGMLSIPTSGRKASKAAKRRLKVLKDDTAEKEGPAKKRAKNAKQQPQPQPQQQQQPQPQPQPQPQQAQTRKENRPRHSPRCGKCGKKGHYQKTCPATTR